MNAQLALTDSTLRLSTEEEFVNMLTHGLGLVLSLVGAFVMTNVYGCDDPWRVAGCSIYLTSLVGVYAMSTLSHCEWDAERRSFYRALDQGAIYLLIAGTYTPFSMAYLQSGPWWMLLALVWIVALGGFASKVLFRHRLESVSMWPCLVLGALPFLAIPTLMGMLSLAALGWMMLGVACYMAGLYFWLNDRKVRHFHAMWHILVIAGSMSHFAGILMFVVRAA